MHTHTHAHTLIPHKHTFSTHTPAYSYLGALGDERRGFFRPERFDSDIHVLAKADHGVKLSSFEAVATPDSTPSLAACRPCHIGTSCTWFYSFSPFPQLPVNPAIRTPAAPVSGGLLPKAHYAAAKN